jgi:hypothetical protein
MIGRDVEVISYSSIYLTTAVKTQSLKVVIAADTIVPSGVEATMLENASLNHMDTDHSDPVFRSALCRREQRADPA